MLRRASRRNRRVGVGASTCAHALPGGGGCRLLRGPAGHGARQGLARGAL